MKETKSIVMMVLLLASILAVPMAFAEEELEEEEVPSFFRYSWAKFRLNFVRNQTVRAERELQLARWKSAEARLTIQTGNIRRAERAMDESERMMARVQERVSKMESLTPGLDQAIQSQERRRVGLNIALENAELTEEQRERIENNLERIQEVSMTLERNRERIQRQKQESSETSKEVGDGAINASQLRDEILQRIENENPNLSIKERQQILDAAVQAERMARGLQEDSNQGNGNPLDQLEN